jgi:hypothetical protein
LKAEAVRNSGKNEALAEIERVKAELKAHREAEKMQEQNLFTAMNKYSTAKPPNPPVYEKPISLPS